MVCYNIEDTIDLPQEKNPTLSIGTLRYTHIVEPNIFLEKLRQIQPFKNTNIPE